MDKATKVFRKLAQKHYSPDTADEYFNNRVSKGRALVLLKKKFNLKGKIADDVRITGGVYSDKTNQL